MVLAQRLACVAGGTMESATWRRAAEWLVQVGVMPRDHRCLQQQASSTTLVHCLRDGVLLCRLLHALDSGSIDLAEVNMRPQMAQFLCLKNIRVFLASCSLYYGLSSSDLFDPSMLFDYTDFSKVIGTLSVLSATPAALALGAHQFSACSGVDERMDEGFDPDLDEQPDADCSGAAIVDNDSACAEENVYEHLCHVSLATQTSDSAVSTATTRPPDKRDYCVSELLDTETNYLHVLQLLVQQYCTPLRAVLSEQDADVVFHGIKELHAVHSELLAELSAASDTQQMASVFVSSRDRLLVYGRYCANLQRAQRCLDQLSSRDEVFAGCLAKCELEANGGKFRLRDLLSVPMQRILKYEILLRELLKHTIQYGAEGGGGADCGWLRRAVAVMKDVAEYINEVKRDHETLQIIDDIESSITGLSLDDSSLLRMRDCGRLLKDGELKVKCHPDTRLKLRYAFVFDEVMIFCKSTKGEQYVFKELLRLADFNIEQCSPAVSSSSASHQSQESSSWRPGGDSAAARWTHSWHLVHCQQRAVYELSASTHEARRSWVAALRCAKESVCPSEAGFTDHQFKLHTFNGPHECDTCLRLLKGVFRQGYLCRLCERKAHRQCISGSGMCGARGRPGSVSGHMTAGSSGAQEPDICSVHLPTRYRTRSQQSSPLPRRLSGDDVTLQRQGSLCSRVSSMTSSVTHNTRHHVAVSNSTAASQRLPDYVNLTLEDQQWWAGEMDRTAAERVLAGRGSGTFLVRLSLAQHNRHVLSLRTAEKVSHMKIREELEEPDTRFYYSLSGARRFPSILQLVHFYQRHSLAENFSGLHVRLGRAWRSEERALVKFKYCQHGGAATNVLAMNAGDEVVILSRDGENHGWWKGRIGDRTGYFPKSYVQEIQ